MLLGVVGCKEIKVGICVEMCICADGVHTHRNHTALISSVVGNTAGAGALQKLTERQEPL